MIFFVIFFVISVALETHGKNITSNSIICTWPFMNAVINGYESLLNHPIERERHIEGVLSAVSTCEREQCDGTVGFGGSADEVGETTLDSVIQDGDTMNAGSVASLKRVKDAARVARAVMLHTRHTLLVSEGATKFAVQMGFTEESLTTGPSAESNNNWRNNNNCQPNFWENVTPDPRSSCGPYKPSSSSSSSSMASISASIDGPDRIRQEGHDTIGCVTLSANGSMAAGTSTNGANNKIPGRVGDSPIIGSGAYVDSEVGGCAGTGEGDILMRFAPCVIVVEAMRNGANPQQAVTLAIERMVSKRGGVPFAGALIALNNQGEYAGACCGGFSFYSNSDSSNGIPVLHPCTSIC